MTRSLAAAIRAVLLTAEPRPKVMATRKLVRDWHQGRLAWRFDVTMPDNPARPATPRLLPPAQMPKRGRGGSERGRIALWHSIAHIEFVAIDLALDMVGRFGSEMNRQFADDFLTIAAEEALHFALIERHLREFGSHYGALPAHAGLWQAADATRNDVMARLAVVPLVLEARGLDVTPALRDRVMAAGDMRGGRILERILDDEIRHVATGARHFEAACRGLAEEPESRWKWLVNRYFGGSLKAPFNDSARRSAGLSRYPYRSLAS